MSRCSGSFRANVLAPLSALPPTRGSNAGKVHPRNTQREFAYVASQHRTTTTTTTAITITTTTTANNNNTLFCLLPKGSNAVTLGILALLQASVELGALGLSQRGTLFAPILSQLN